MTAAITEHVPVHCVKLSVYAPAISELLLSERHGKRTNYRRNEEIIKAFAEFIGKEL